MTAIGFTILLTGCSQLTTNVQPSLFKTEVKPVMTESSEVLSCLGDLVDSSDKSPMVVYVDHISDKTVPRRHRDRRLSRGGEWWLHTAISKMQSDLVTSTVDSPSSKDKNKQNHLVLRGAWTQDDLEVGENRKGLDVENNGNGNFGFFNWGGSRKISVIAGDFLSEINGKVVHASAISLAVGGYRNGFDLRIDDGQRRVDVGIVSEINEGPQFAQRRIAEAAVLVHVAKAFDVDYRSCVSQDFADLKKYRQQIKSYLSEPPHGQFKMMQEALSEAGFSPGVNDGKWGKKSKAALIAFQSSNDLPLTGVPSVELYSLVIGKKLVSTELYNLVVSKKYVEGLIRQKNAS